MVSETLLMRYFRHDVDDTEKRQVEDWINQSEENKLLARQIARICIADRLLQDSEEVNIAGELDKFWHKAGRKSKKHAVLKFMAKAAAAVLLPVVAASIYFLAGGLEPTPTRWLEARGEAGKINTILLPDSSLIYLHANAVLKYPEHFGDVRQVNLQGKAYFKVKKQPRKRFIVNATQGAKVEVLGTEFSMTSASEAVSATLVNGSVKFVCPDSQDQKKEVLMTPGQKAEYDVGSSGLTVKNIDIEAETGWKDGKIILRKSTLTEALNMLSDKFGVTFQVQDEALKQYQFTGTFKGEDLKQILNNFTLACNIKYRLQHVTDNETGTQQIHITIY